MEKVETPHLPVEMEELLQTLSVEGYVSWTLAIAIYTFSIP